MSSLKDEGEKLELGRKSAVEVGASLKLELDAKTLARSGSAGWAEPWGRSWRLLLLSCMLHLQDLELGSGPSMQMLIVWLTMTLKIAVPPHTCILSSAYSEHPKNAENSLDVRSIEV